MGKLETQVLDLAQVRKSSVVGYLVPVSLWVADVELSVGSEVNRLELVELEALSIVGSDSEGFDVA